MEKTRPNNLGKELVTVQSDHVVESALRIEEPEQPMNNSCPSLGHQSWVHSLTPSEFQNTHTNEFLKSIWNAEDNEAQGQNGNSMVPPVEAQTSLPNMDPQYLFGETPKESGNTEILMGLTRQGPLSVTAPLSLKTADEVWSEINRTQQNTNNIPREVSNQSEPSDEEITLEEFLVMAGVVCEEGDLAQMPPPRPHPQHQIQTHPTPSMLQPHPLLPRPPIPYDMYCNSATSPNFMILGSGGMGSIGVPSSFGEMDPLSSQGIDTNNPGRKRIRDELVERGIEKHQARIVKNRESAARSRAREQAYVNELEAELTQFKQENASLKQRLEEVESKCQQQQQLEAAKAEAKAKGKLEQLRRTCSCPY